MVRAGDFLWVKAPQSHAGHGVVGKKQLSFGNRVLFEKSVVVFR